MPTLQENINRGIRTGSNQALKISIRSLIDIYKDNWLHLLNMELAKQFSPSTLKKLYWLKTQELNVLKRVTNDLSMIYKEPAERRVFTEKEEKIDNVSTKEKIDDEAYEKATKGNGKDGLMKQVNRYTNLTNHTVVKVDVRHNKLDYELLTFDNVEVYTDPLDWKRIIAIKYYVGAYLPIDYGYQTENPSTLQSPTDLSNIVSITGANVNQYQVAYVWTSDDIRNNGIIENEGYPNLEGGKVYTLNSTKDQEMVTSIDDNPYTDKDGNSVLPFVIFDKNVPVSERFDFSTGNDLRDLTMGTAVNLVHINELIKYQSYKQIFIITKDRKNVPTNLTIGPSSVTILETGVDGKADAKTLDLQTDIEKLYDLITNRIVTTLTGYGVSPENFKMTGNAASGLSLKISNIGKLESRKDQIEMYRIKEHELFEVERIVWNTNKPENLIDIKADFTVDFEEPSFPIDKTEKAAWLTFLRQSNTITDIDIMMDQNPDLTEEQAAKKVAKNKAINTVSTIGLKPLQPPANNEA